MAQTDNSTRIQNFNLFGEAGDLPDVVHCETIETRSQLHDWEFSPHRHARLHQVLLVASGGGRAQIEGQVVTLRPGHFVNVPTGSVHGFSFLEDTEGWVVTIGTEILDQTLHESEGLRPVLAQAVIAETSNEINALILNIFREHSARGFGRAHILRALSGQLVGQVARRIFDTGQAGLAVMETSLQRRFLALVEDQFLNHWSVTDYAAELAVSTTHLSRVMRNATGQAASRIIEARMVREARRQLAYTNLSIQQVAYALGYIDPAYFSRVFSRACGMSPRAFRLQREDI